MGGVTNIFPLCKSANIDFCYAGEVKIVKFLQLYQAYHNISFQLHNILKKAMPELFLFCLLNFWLVDTELKSKMVKRKITHALGFG